MIIVFAGQAGNRQSRKPPASLILGRDNAVYQHDPIVTMHNNPGAILKAKGSMNFPPRANMRIIAEPSGRRGRRQAPEPGLRMIIVFAGQAGNRRRCQQPESSIVGRAKAVFPVDPIVKMQVKSWSTLKANASVDWTIEAQSSPPSIFPTVYCSIRVVIR